MSYYNGLIDNLRINKINGSSGTAGQVLTSNGTTASWQTPSGGGGASGSMHQSISYSAFGRSVSSNTSLLLANDIYADYWQSSSVSSNQLFGDVIFDVSTTGNYLIEIQNGQSGTSGILDVKIDGTLAFSIDLSFGSARINNLNIVALTAGIHTINLSVTTTNTSGYNIQLWGYGIQIDYIA